MTESIYNLSLKTVELLRKNNLKISTAESCTGGLISAYITDIPGSSSVFELGITSYSSRIKNEKLDVKSETLKKYGAVSRQTAAEMAENIRLISKADIGVSATGSAGPAPSEGHAPGLVFIAVSQKNNIKVKQLNIEFKSRDYVRKTAVSEIFKLIIECIEGNQNEI